MGEKEELKAFTTAGFFGSEYGPMNLPYPEQAVKSVQPPAGMEPGRFSNRYKHFKKLLDQNPNRELMSDFQHGAAITSMDFHPCYFQLATGCADRTVLLRLDSDGEHVHFTAEYNGDSHDQHAGSRIGTARKGRRHSPRS